MPTEFKSPYHPFTDEQLKKSYWIVTHKIFIKRLLYSMFILIDFGLFLFSAYKLINFYTTENTQYQRIMADLSETNLNYAILKNQAENLELGEVKILPSGQSAGTSKYDLIAEAFNPNDKFKMELTYQFISGGMPLNEHLTYILPGQRIMLAEYGIEMTGKNAQLAIKNLSFKRISSKNISDPIGYINERINFPLTNALINSVNLKNEFTKVSFDLKNDTVYNYWEAGLTILLYANNNIIGINKITTEKFMAGETRPIEINWYYLLPQDIRISVIPEIDVFNPAAYIKYTGTQENLGQAEEEKN